MLRRSTGKESVFHLMEREEDDENEYKQIKSPWMVETDLFAEFSARGEKGT